MLWYLSLVFQMPAVPGLTRTFFARLLGMRPATLLLSVLALASPLTSRAQALPAAAISGGPPPQTIVIGFMGGKVSHEDATRNELIISERLRAAYPRDVHFEVFENRRLEDAHQRVLQLLSNFAGNSLSQASSQPISRSLAEQQKRRARIILFGHSWGASAVVTLADELQKDGIPVLLTIQVDSIEKHGQDDAVIPANVERAVNFYQPDGVLHGRPEIHAANPERTQILGNFRYSYKDAPAECSVYPWFERVFIKTHIAIECDPVLWQRIEGLIRESLGPPQETAAR
jgi:hypothetical protein